MRRVLTCLTILLITIPIGLTARYTNLPWILAKYLGSMLWATALYWLIAAILPRQRPRTLAIIASITAILIELSRLVPQPQIDAFRLTLAGKLLLGRFFSVKNIAAYLIAIALTAATDQHFHPGRPSINPS